ncbi:hypothetical protein EVAR_95396_1 [Eumeta japonica]|uniref:Uncharacterized protein n=1 Tax=Eumeta variegata TaxID=151549 RepID=A0A4C1VHT2_EUMVA|nr:hypothetical protein EVAR_95396_1 [Eumeta japonica]
MAYVGCSRRGNNETCNSRSHLTSRSRVLFNLTTSISYVPIASTVKTSARREATFHERVRVMRRLSSHCRDC